MKKNLKLFFITAIVILLPILAGLLLWGKLPEKMPVHWNMNGEVDGWSSRAFCVFGFPFMMLFFQGIVMFATLSDPKNKNASGNMLKIVFWIIPALSLLIAVLTFSTALGVSLSTKMIMPFFLGLVFVVLGFSFPACRQNFTVGIKLPWTLNSEENWNKTHRFAGKIWIAGGFAVMFFGFFNLLWGILLPSFIMAFVPAIYSYFLYKKGI